MREIVVAGFLALEAAAPSPVAGTTGIAASAALASTTFLSTADAQATLTVSNPTALSAVLDLGEATFRVYSNGNWKARPYCRENCLWQHFQIPPATRRSFTIALPSCEALSDPCIEDVALDYPIEANGQTYVQTVRFPQYRFVPDPNATYRDTRDGVAVYLTQGWARTTVVPSSVLVSIRTPPSTSFSTASGPAILVPMVEMFRAAHMALSATTYEPDNPRWYAAMTSGGGAMRWARPGVYPPNSWLMRFRIENAMQQLRVLDETLAQVRRRFGDQIDEIYECAGVAVDGPGAQATWSGAEDDANRQAEQLLQITKGGSLDAGYRIASRLSQPSSREPLCDSDDATFYPAPLTLTPFMADARVQIRHQGTRPPSVEIPPAVVALARAAVTQPRPQSTYAPILSIAADRPELYVTGGASGAASVEAGLVPKAVAILAARAQAKTIAAILGLKLGMESLYATYAPGLWGDAAIGVATTFSRSGVAAAFRVPDAAQSLHLHDVQNSNSIDQNFGPDVPIDVAQPETAIRERTYTQADVPYQLLRFQMELNSDDGPIAVATAPIVAKVRSVPGVVEAVASSSNGGSGVLYDVLVKRSNRAAASQIANLVARSYAPVRAQATFGLDPFIGDCTAFAREALVLTLRESWRAAQAAAAARNVRLRKLLLVAVSSNWDDALCSPLAKDPGGRDYESLSEIPLAPASAVIESSVRLIFRTSR